MNGDADLPQRSSSPLKRRASSMDPDKDPGRKDGDVEMGASPTLGSALARSEAISGAFPRAMSVDPPDFHNDTSIAPETPMPPLPEQVQTIESLLKLFSQSQLQEGDEAYIVSRRWVDKALSLRPNPNEQKSESAVHGLGPIDNSDIVQEMIEEPDHEPFIRLKPGLGLESFELFSKEAWDLIVQWYGVEDNQKAVIRTAINTAPDAQSAPNILYEFHPPVFQIHRLWSEQSPLPIEQALKTRNPPRAQLPRSSKYHAQTFIRDIKRTAGIPADRKIRIWTLPKVLPARATAGPMSAPTPPDSPGATEPEESWSTLLLDVATFSQVRDRKADVPLNDHTTDKNYNGNSSLQHYQLVTDQTLILDEAVDAQQWVSTYSGQSKHSDRALPTRLGNKALSSRSNSGRSSPAPQSSAARGRLGQGRSGRSVGATGLQNLGNTCYMNSALQCVRSVEELTKYFRTEAHLQEINKNNPLGYGGKVALAYAGLINEIYGERRAAVSPREFKTTVGRCRTTFSGWGQQDSQEFLGFLLDALQEDLSRVKKKPYIEKPDSTDDMVNDQAAIKNMADKVWDITRRRDDSVVADLFTGLYKSTLKCPECGKVSITFDPFNNLTLPLPVEDMWSRAVKFYALNDVPVKIEVELPKHSSFEALKQFLSIRTGVPVERLMGAEEFKERFFKLYDNTHDVQEEITSSDIPAFYELESVPTNWPSKGSKKPYRSMLDVETPLDSEEWDDDPRYECLLVPVFHRRPEASARGSDSAAPPHFICLNKEQAWNHDIITRKVLEKISTFSTWTGFHNSSVANSFDSPDADLTLGSASDGELLTTSNSDTELSGDGQIAACSIEGEDDMVDVTMVDEISQARTSSTGANSKAQILRQFNTKRPKFINPETFLEPQLQNLFDLAYFSNSHDGASAVPTGWSSFDNNKTLPKLSDRIPKAHSGDGDAQTPTSWSSATSGGEESNNEERSSREGSRTADKSSEEGDGTEADAEHRGDPAVLSARTHEVDNGRQNLKGNGVSRKKKFKNYKTYGKKGNKRRDKDLRVNRAPEGLPTIAPQPLVAGKPDNGPLIRLGEGIVVDWNEKAWEQVFGGSLAKEPGDRGSRTFTNLEVIADAGLKTNQRRRQNRKSRGITLDECLDAFARAEVLSEQDMWYCPRCKEHRRASKKFDLWKTPDILIAHLKRFSSSGWRRDKLDVHVDFPIEGLDLTSRVVQKEEGKEEIYDLIAVDDHYGGLGGGHYTAYAKNFVDGQWYNYNDSSVSVLQDPSSAVTNAAYLLFYRRRSKVPAGGLRFSEITKAYEASDEASGDDGTTEFGEDGSPHGGDTSIKRSWSREALGSAHSGPDRVTTKTTIRALDGSEDEMPPSYDDLGAREVVHNSIEDEGIEMSSPYQRLDSRSLSMTQGWDFNPLNQLEQNSNNGEAGYGSDDAQADSDERGRSSSRGFDDAEMDIDRSQGDPLVADKEESMAPAPNNVAQTAVSNIQDDIWRHKGVISVPTTQDSDGSGEVAEIRLEGERAVKGEQM